jgi:hypothetical protein
LSEAVDVKEHLQNLINALTNLSPSRNLISQFILMLPKDLSVIECSYPEITSSTEAKALMARSFGIEFGESVKRIDNSFSVAFYVQNHKLFDWLANEDTRSSLAKLSDMPVSSIQNPYAEWVKLVLKKLSGKPNGSKILDFLKMLVERDSYIVAREGYSRGAYQPDWQPFLDEARKRLKVSPAEFEEILRLTISMPGGAEHVSAERSAYSDTNTWLEHSEYHLDLILSKQTRTGTGYSHWYYDYLYIIRHKELVKNILREVFL